ITIGRIYCRLGPEGVVNISVGEGKTMKFYCDQSPTLSQEYDVGNYFEADVEIKYYNMLTGKNHESIGRLYGVVEGYDVGNGTTTPTGTTSTTTTTGTVTTTCPPLSCVHPGYINDTECTWPGCSYCRWSGLCDVTGYCGRNCTQDSECIDPSSLDQNPCPYCNVTTGRCEEPHTDCGKPCVPGETVCNIPCRHCFSKWSTTYNVSKAYCENDRDNCGKPCNASWFDTYNDCVYLCMWCNGTSGKCEEGDCGKHCPDDSSCNLGCHWCNLTSQSCESGDCGKDCNTDNAFEICILGCDKCQNGKCVDLLIAVAINATNTTGGKFVGINETIHLNATAEADKGVEQLIVSEGVPTPSGDCSELVKTIEALNPNGITDPWTQANQIPWFDKAEAHMCLRLNECKHGWLTKESEENVFCYYAIAQENQAFGGKWSYIAWDTLDIGYIKVQLAGPRPIR
ncbi:MAG: hypothetical protein NTU61_02315, partial [Candidatus Altiarchaeota archaeon]|nr:hypothetical protein [Candidatus Altiarchaeota archaeon]